MFKCEKCKMAIKKRQKQYTITIETREKIYDNIVNKVIKHGKKTKRFHREFTTKGFEIKREIKVCSRCKNTLEVSKK